MLTQLDSENADRDLTSQVTVLTHTPSDAHPMRCVGVIELGDGAKDLDSGGGELELEITIGSQTLEPSPTVVERSAATRVVIETSPFAVLANRQVILKLKSTNDNDSDVDTTAYLLDAGDTERHLCKAALANSLTVEQADGEIKVLDDDGKTVLRTITPVVDIAVTGANWTDATKRLTETGAFANYIHASGDTIVLTAGTGVVTGEYTISDKIDDDTIELVEDINGAGGDISDNSVVGLISNDRIMATAT